MNNKIIESLIYITQRSPTNTRRKLYQLLYLADIHHLSKYGRFVTGDEYMATKDGSVPIQIQKLVEQYDEESFFNGLLIGLTPYLDEFSDSDIECLDYILEKYGNESDEMLKNLTCNAAWRVTAAGSEIKLRDIITMLPNKEELLDYLQHEGQI